MAEFQIVAEPLDDVTADLAGFQVGHTFRLVVDGERVLRAQGWWNGRAWSEMMAADIRQAVLDRIELVRQVAQDPATEVVDYTRGR